MNEEKEREAEEQRKWQKLVDAMRAKEYEKAKRIAAEIEQAQKEKKR
jgi:hypothetical protein